MSEDIPSSSILDDGNQGTPLDLLLNAISGGQQYPYASQDEQSLQGLLEADAFIADDMGEEGMPSSKQPREDDDSSLRGAKTAKTAGATRRPDIAATLKKGDEAFSKIEVWHPSTGQKSYGKERRMLNPPPVLRVTGPLFPQLTSVTLASMTSPTARADLQHSSPGEMAHQSHHIPLNQSPIQSIPYNIYAFKNRKTIKAAERHNIQVNAEKSGFAASLPHLRSVAGEREREALRDGLSFPGLWVGDEVGKDKEFKLELRLEQPGVEVEKEDLRTVKRSRTADATLSTDGNDRQTEDNEKDEDDLNLGSAEATLDNATSAALTLPRPKSTPWATIHSVPLSIVSKPSQKTAKARSMTSCLTTSSPIALWVRINSQTVRTKYMKVSPSNSITDTHDLTAKTGKWTPFRFEVVTRVAPPTQFIHRRGRYSTDDDEVALNVLTYGSVVVLVDLQSGVRSEKVKLVRVDKGEVVLGDDTGCPVSELQRVGFLRVQDGQGQTESGGRWYLSAPGARAGGGEMLPPSSATTRKRKNAASEAIDIDPDTLGGIDAGYGGAEGGPEQAKVKKIKTKRHALAMAVLAEADEGDVSSVLSWAKAEKQTKDVEIYYGKVKASKVAEVETVEDWMCWVIGGVSSFSYTVFDAFADDSSNDLQSFPAGPIDPLPHVLTAPRLDPDTNTLDLVLSTNIDQNTDPLDIYLGPIGPLPYTTWRSTSPATSTTETTTMSRTPAIHVGMDNPDDLQIKSSFPSAVEHIITVIRLPSLDDIVEAIQGSGGLKGKGKAVDLGLGELAEQDLGFSATELALASIPFGSEQGMGDDRLESGKESGSLGDIDPALAGELGGQGGMSGELAMDPGDMVDGKEADDAGQAMTLNEAEVRESSLGVGQARTGKATKTGIEMGSMPLLLIRKSDGLGFGTGCRVVVEKKEGGLSESESIWVLRLAQS